jgi:hypothetical protein
LEVRRREEAEWREAHQGTKKFKTGTHLETRGSMRRADLFRMIHSTIASTGLKQGEVGRIGAVAMTISRNSTAAISPLEFSIRAQMSLDQSQSYQNQQLTMHFLKNLTTRKSNSKK